MRVRGFGRGCAATTLVAGRQGSDRRRRRWSLAQGISDWNGLKRCSRAMTIRRNKIVSQRMKREGEVV
jgi:hypothetical protein